jgi:hypothetical protein
MDLHRFNVPMLLVAPGIQEKFGHRIHTVGNQTVAIIEDDRILVLPNRLAPKQYRYRLGAAAQAVLQPVADEAMLARLQTYVQIASTSLMNNTAGARADQ